MLCTIRAGASGSTHTAKVRRRDQAHCSPQIVLDHFHLVMLGNVMVTDVRTCVLREQLGRRGMKIDPAWAHRWLLLRGGNQLSAKARTRLNTDLADDDPTNETSAAWDSYASSWPHPA